MASPVTHAVVALSLGAAWNHSRSDWKILAWGVVCAEIPDVDVLGFWFGVPYGALWGHRGMTHSLLFAAVFAAVLVPVTGEAVRESRPQIRRWLYLFLATASHGLSDAVTNGGLGVALFAPFDNTRYFFPFRPVNVSPIGLREFFSPTGVRVVISEAIWIWIPCLVFIVASAGMRRLLPVRVDRGHDQGDPG